MEIIASYHALHRWRERFAAHMSENIEDIRKRLDPLIAAQGPPREGITYYSDNELVFVIEKNNKLTTIVTITKKDKSNIPEPQLAIEIPAFSDLRDRKDWLKKELIQTKKLIHMKAYRQRLQIIEEKLAEVNKAIKEKNKQEIQLGQQPGRTNYRIHSHDST